MNGRARAARLILPLLIGAVSLLLAVSPAGQSKASWEKYKVGAPIMQGHLQVFPVTTEASRDTSGLLTLEEGIRAGSVVVSEQSETTGLVRPRNRFRPLDGISGIDPGIWTERPFPMPPRVSGAQVNELAIVNNSDRPLLLLAGEIVTGGKQDRVVGRDRIIPPHSKPVALGVFCVEPHRWTGSSLAFGTLPSAMAQPSVRFKAMAEKDQQAVWDQVEKLRAGFLSAAPAPAARELEGTSSYAMSVQNSAVKTQVETIAGPIDRKYEKLFGQLQADKAVGAVVAVDGEIIWADVFASQALFEKYWPKLIRSYAAEAIRPRFKGIDAKTLATAEQAQNFVEHLEARNENVETEPGVYRNTEFIGDDFDAFVLTGLLPQARYTVHVAKMSR
jgi:hypothetical protein